MTTGTVEPSGLGGWLILPAIGLLISPVLMLVSLNNDLLPVFQEGYWEILTTPGSGAYHPLWAPLIIFEVLGNIIFVILNIILIFMFFSKSYRFPTLMIIYLSSNLLFIVSDFFLVDLIPGMDEQIDFQSIKEIVQMFISAMIWIPYFLVSKRVKNTFVKPSPDKEAIEVFS